jgi:ABC-2 type transport system ATP-binding protein
MDDIAIKVEGVYKNFILPHEKTNSIKGIVTGLTKGSLWKTKGTQRALKDISFEIKKGEFFGIVGRNGSGKSTLLKILAGIYQPTKGSVYTNGKLVPFIELGVGFNPELTGRENVYLNGAMLGFSKKEVEAMYDEIVSFAELEKFMDQKLKNYSSGMQVRLAFSMATKSKADILLVDEVLAVGDADFQRKCFDYFHKLKKQSTTVIFVSHDMGAIREYCDRALLVEKSVVVKEGSGESVADLYTRMFFDKTSDSLNDLQERWGDGKAVIENVKVEPGLLTDDVKSVQLSWQVKVKQKIEKPIHGFIIKSPNGSSLVGTNTLMEHVKTEDQMKGETVSIEWTVPNIFSEGRYSVVPAVVAEDKYTVYDWWEEAAHFEVKHSERSPYPVQPDISVSIKRQK